MTSKKRARLAASLSPEEYEREVLREAEARFAKGMKTKKMQKAKKTRLPDGTRGLNVRRAAMKAGGRPKGQTTTGRQPREMGETSLPAKTVADVKSVGGLVHLACDFGFPMKEQR
jgi:hypothetical protein